MALAIGKFKLGLNILIIFLVKGLSGTAFIPVILPLFTWT
jgi:hypothetical protein